MTAQPNFSVEIATPQGRYQQPSSNTAQEPEEISQLVQFSRIPAQIRSYIPDIGCSAYTLLTLLYDYTGAKPTCWPSQETLAKMLGLSVRYVRELTRKLEEYGLITTTYAKPKPGSKYPCTVYTVTHWIPPKKEKLAEPQFRQKPNHSSAKSRNYSSNESHVLESYKKDSQHMIEEAVPNKVIPANKDVCVPLLDKSDNEKRILESNSKPVFKGKDTPPISATPPAILKDLLATGLNEKYARELVEIAAANRGPEEAEVYIKRWIEVAKSKYNPPGYIRSVIQDNLDPLPEYRQARQSNRPWSPSKRGSDGSELVTILGGIQVKKSEEAFLTDPDWIKNRLEVLEMVSGDTAEEQTAIDQEKARLKEIQAALEEQRGQKQIENASHNERTEPAEEEEIVFRTNLASVFPGIIAASTALPTPPVGNIDVRLKNTLARIDSRAASYLWRTTVECDTLKVRFISNYHFDYPNEWLSDVQLFYPQVKRIEILEH